MIDRLYTYIVGGMRIAPSEFWGMTVKEANLAIKGDRVRQENDFMVEVYSHMNALGSCLSKNHKFINPFKPEEESKNKKKTPEQLKSELNDLINSWR